MIAIYEGEGTLWSGKNYPRISAQQILKGALQNLSWLIMPGGRDRPYHQALKGEPNRLLKQFVLDGGTYLGICAGAYYGCKSVEFEKGFPLEICEERELQFFSGKAVGPAYGKGIFSYGSETGARIAPLLTPYGMFYSYFNGGCFFEGDVSSCHVLATYADLPKHPPAILEIPLGKGRAILSGVHIETLFSSELCQHPSSNQVEVEVKDRLARIGATVG